MCSNCKGGFGAPIACGGCNTGCCPTLSFPCTFGACVNNPGCECCKEKAPKGKCKWPCMWPCCCECEPPKFKFKPLKPKPVCHCPSPHSHHCGCGICRSTKSKHHDNSPAAKRDFMYPYGYPAGFSASGLPFIAPFPDSSGPRGPFSPGFRKASLSHRVPTVNGVPVKPHHFPSSGFAPFIHQAHGIQARPFPRPF